MAIKATKIFVLILTASTAVVLLMLFWQKFNDSFVKTFSVAVENCMNITDHAEEARCLDDYSRQILARGDIQTVLADFASALKISPRVREDCHQAAHALGRAALVKLGSIAAVFDLEREIETCGGGFFHGAIEKLFRQDGDIPEDEHITLEEMEEKIPTLCGQFADPQRHSECVHGIGHGLFYLLGVLDPAKSRCAVFEKNAEHFSCLSGIFMEYNVSQDTGNTFPDNPDYPCDGLAGFERDPCYYVLSFRLVNLGFSGGEIMKECAKIEGLAGELCSRGYGIFYLAHIALAGGESEVRDFCSALPVASARFCAEAVSARMTAYSMSGSKSMPFCAGFSSGYLRGSCFAYVAEVLRQRENMTGVDIAAECRKHLKNFEECATFIDSEPVLQN